MQHWLAVAVAVAVAAALIALVAQKHETFPNSPCLFLFSTDVLSESDRQPGWG